jgi:type I restriction enzyme, S subunit
MTKTWPKVSLSRVLAPIDRPHAPVPGHLYRQIGVRLWGQGAYEREPLDGAGTKYQTLSRVDTDDIIVNKIWARNGSVAVVPSHLAGCYASGEFPLFVPNRDTLDPRWFHWITRTSGFWQQCDEKSRGTSGKNRIRPEQFLQIEIPVPAMTEQRRIVARIEELSASIEEAKISRNIAAEEAQRLSHSAAESVFQKLAQRHGVAKFGELSRSVTDGDHNTPSFADRGIRFIFVGNVSSGSLHFRDSKYVDEHYFRTLKPQRVPKRGDILYSAVGATLGVPAIVDCDELFCFQRHIAIVKLDLDRMDTRFCLAYASLEDRVQQGVELHNRVSPANRTASRD